MASAAEAIMGIDWPGVSAAIDGRAADSFSDWPMHPLTALGGNIDMVAKTNPDSRPPRVVGEVPA